MSVKTVLTSLADKIRNLLGISSTMSLETMGAHIDTVNTEVNTQADLIEQIKTALANKTLGVILPTLTNPGDASKLLEAYELIDQDGNIVTGTIPIKTLDDITADGSLVTVPTGYYDSEYSRMVDSVDLQTPSVSIDSSTGLVTASIDQAAGYTSGGVKEKTLQLNAQAAKIITPTTEEQVAVAAGVFTTGEIKVAAAPAGLDTSDADAAENDIAEGKSGYVNGTKVTGTIPVVTGITNTGCTAVESSHTTNITDSDGNITSTETVIDVKISANNPNRHIIEAGGTIALSADSAQFGDVTAEEVPAGKKFTAKGLFNATGTAPIVEGVTITPGSADQTVVAAKSYVSGDVIVAGDANLLPENIAEGVTIFGITGTHAGGTGGSTESIPEAEGVEF